MQDDEGVFTEKLYAFMSSRGTPIVRIPVFDHRDLNLYKLYKEVTSRGGVEIVILNKMWRSVTNELAVDPDRTDAGYRLRTHYLKYLYPFERKFFLGLGDDGFDFAAFERMLTKAANGANPKETKGRGAKGAHADQDDMNSELYPDADLMNHYTYPNPEIQANNFHTPNNSRFSPITTQDQFQYPSHPTHRGGKNTSNGNHAGTENTRVGTRARGSRVNASHAALSSPDEKDTEYVKETTKGRGKRARAEKKDAIIEEVIDANQASLATDFSKLDLGALKKYKQYHQMRLDTSANKSEIIEAVSTHFSQQQVDEAAIIRKFVAHVKSESDTRREREARRRHSKIVRA